MRKLSKRFGSLTLVILLLAIVSAMALSGCSGGHADKMYEGYTDLAKNADFYVNGKNVGSFKASGKLTDKQSIIVDLKEPKEFNTIVLSESGKHVTMFSIFASNDMDHKSFKLIYEGDTIENYRTCFVGNIKYRYLRIEVANSTDKYKLNGIRIYNNINDDTSRRVVSYFLLDRINDRDLKALDTITDLMLFTFTRFDKDGLVRYYYQDKPEAEVKAMFEANLAKLKEAVNEVETKQGRKINIFATILMPFSDDPNDANKYSRAIMGDNAQNTANNIKAFLDEYELDGLDLDYEYPYSGKEHKLFDEFLVTIKNTIGEKKLSTALGAWNIKMSKEAIAAVDQVQLMTYDIFDSHGYHGSFYTSMLRDVDTAISKGIPEDKINIGLPFYSRPLSKSGYWGDYFRFYNEGLIKNRYQNIIYSYEAIDSAGVLINEPEYLNGPQMVMDKTSFAIDAPIGGVMVWHYHCDIDYDNEMSLFRAINDTFVAKNAKLASHK